MRFDAVLLAALALILPSAVSLAPVYHYTQPSNRISSNSSRTSTSRLSANLQGSALFTNINFLTASLALHSEPNVEYIEKDAIAHGISVVSQRDASWGLARLSTRDRLVNQNPKDVNFTYRYNSTAQGEGTDIYIIDTGIYIENEEFESRAMWGANFVEFESHEDLHGHGTHCAGIAGGRRFGVAKQARIISVKVMDANNGGHLTNILAGMDFIYKSASSGTPSIASVSIATVGGDILAHDLWEEAVNALTGSGVHVVVGAGNDGVDALNTSPARVPSAITVGATDITDTMASFSNFGCRVDIFAPGVDIVSASIGCPNGVAFMNGTSMATPYVAGLVASLISSDGNLPPAEMKIKLQGMALQGAISNVRFGTPNLLANNVIVAQ